MLENKTPLVSIIIPVYNGADYLAEAIESALDQTYQNIEVLVVNDGSNDGGKTRNIAESYGAKIRYFEKENGGVSTALNLGIHEMRGDYFSWLSHDDLYLRNKVEKQINVLLNEKNKLAIAYSDSTTFSGCKINSGSAISAAPPRNKSFRYFVATSNVIHGCSLLIPKKAFEIFGSFDEKLRYVQDYEMWFRLADEFAFIHIPEVLVLGRAHHNQTGNMNKWDAKHEVDLERSKFFKLLKPADFGSSSNKFPCASILSFLGFAINNGYPLLTEAVYKDQACNKSFKYIYMKTVICLNIPMSILRCCRNNVKNICKFAHL